jgi:hypothetical protein
MSELSPTEPGTQACVVCREPIKLGARKCVHCDSPQGWMRYLGVSTTILALLIALISVSQSALPVFLKIAEGEHTKLKLNLLSIGDTTATFLVTNSGTMPGRLGNVWITRDDRSKAWPDFKIAYLREETLIRSGEMREVSLRLNPGGSNACGSYEKLDDGKILSANINIYLIDYNGESDLQSFPVHISCNKSRWEFLTTITLGAS